MIVLTLDDLTNELTRLRYELVLIERSINQANESLSLLIQQKNSNLIKFEKVIEELEIYKSISAKEG